MNWTAAIANTLWATSNLPAHLRFRRVLREPKTAQRKRLFAYLKANADTAFGRAHDFASIRTYEDFARRVPLADYGGLETWIKRIQAGEVNVLTRERVTHLVPTSGSSGARKLIPFTAGLQREFNAALGAWLVDLARQQSGILCGPAYWSVTPALRDAPPEASAVPIGFEADTAYLGGPRKWLADAAMAVPANVQQADSVEEFRYRTLLRLLRCRELRLISVWHPSFLTLLLDALPTRWERLLNDLPERAWELREIGPQCPERLWPKLRVISCWGDGAAELGLAELRRRFPNVHIQPKGLLATEAFVSLPFAGAYPLAVTAHFFEFLDDAGHICLPEQLNRGSEYQVVVTTAGGLWRYRLGDLVRVTGWLGQTPTLKFLGRNGNVSDCCGEKLSETFVAEVLRGIFLTGGPRFALLAPDDSTEGCGYTLYLEGAASSDCAERLDAALCRNPHYAYCRQLGQLQAPRLFAISDRGYEAYAARLAARGARLGDIKPAALSQLDGWSDVFAGGYLSSERRSSLAPV